MSLDIRLRLIGQKPEINKILEREGIGTYSFEDLPNGVFLQFSVATTSQFYEIKRRLGGKRCRKTTVEILGIRKCDNHVAV